MTVVVNGREMEVPEGTTVADLLERLGLAGRPAAVERNRQVVTRERRSCEVLADGDRIEVVTLVGGG